METKEYLSQIGRLDRAINNKLSELAQYKELAHSVSAVKNTERVQSSMSYDKLGDSVAKIQELEKEVDTMIDEYVDKKRKIISQIDDMENENTYHILFARYVEKKTFEVISIEMNYSFRQTTRLHGRALQEFEQRWGDTYRQMS